MADPSSYVSFADYLGLNDEAGQQMLSRTMEGSDKLRSEAEAATAARFNAAKGGTAASAEATASPAISKMNPASSNFSGVCTITPTLGTAGAVLDGYGWTVPEIGAGAADPGTGFAQCYEYGDGARQMPTVVAGTTNGISISVTAAGAGGLAAGSITATIIEE